MKRCILTVSVTTLMFLTVPTHAMGNPLTGSTQHTTWWQRQSQRAKIGYYCLAGLAVVALSVVAVRHKLQPPPTTTPTLPSNLRAPTPISEPQHPARSSFRSVEASLSTDEKHQSAESKQSAQAERQRATERWAIIPGHAALPAAGAMNFNGSARLNNQKFSCIESNGSTHCQHVTVTELMEVNGSLHADTLNCAHLTASGSAHLNNSAVNYAEIAGSFSANASVCDTVVARAWQVTLDNTTCDTLRIEPCNGGNVVAHSVIVINGIRFSPDSVAHSGNNGQSQQTVFLRNRSWVRDIIFGLGNGRVILESGSTVVRVVGGVEQQQ